MQLQSTKRLQSAKMLVLRIQYLTITYFKIYPCGAGDDASTYTVMSSEKRLVRT